MAKRTKKYVAALSVAGGLGITETDDAEGLYQALTQKNFFWDPGEGRWIPGSEPDAPSELIRVRVWAETSKVAEVANTVIRRMTQGGYVLLEKSEPYVCRPPKQAESRIYLTFREEL